MTDDRRIYQAVLAEEVETNSNVWDDIEGLGLNLDLAEDRLVTLSLHVGSSTVGDGSRVGFAITVDDVVQVASFWASGGAGQELPFALRRSVRLSAGVYSVEAKFQVTGSTLKVQDDAPTILEATIFGPNWDLG